MFEQVQDIIAEVLGTEKENIKLASSLTEDLGADSLDALDIATQIEEVLSVKIPDEEFTKFETVQDIVNYLETGK